MAGTQSLNGLALSLVQATFLLRRFSDRGLNSYLYCLYVRAIFSSAFNPNLSLHSYEISDVIRAHRILYLAYKTYLFTARMERQFSPSSLLHTHTCIRRAQNNCLWHELSVCCEVCLKSMLKSYVWCGDFLFANEPKRVSSNRERKRGGK